MFTCPKILQSSYAQHKSLLLTSVILLVTMTSQTSYAKGVSSTKVFSSVNSNALTIATQEPNNASTKETKEEIQLGKTIERELSGDAFHSYILKLEVNQYLNLVVEQKGIDVVVTLYNPSGEKVYEVDSPNGTEGPEPVYLISQSSGDYRLEIRSLEKTAALGKYDAKIIEIRTAMPEDIDRVDGFKALGEAVLLDGEDKIDNVDNAIKKYQEAISKLEKTSEQISLATALNSLATAYLKTGEYDKAEPLINKALNIRKKRLGEIHSDTATSLNVLAQFYNYKGDYEKAILFHSQDLAITKKIFGDSNPAVATSLDNLAEAYVKKGDYTKAEPLYTQALNIRRKALGDNHPDTAFSINNLATLYYSKGDYEKAEPLFIQASEIFKKSFGDSHPYTVTSISNLGQLYSNIRDYKKAEPLFIQVLETLRKAFGENRPELAHPLNNLAALYYNKGDYEKAEPLFTQALEIFKKYFGNDHPFTYASLDNLAAVYFHKGDNEKAEPLFIQALEFRRKTLGDAHPDTIFSLNKLIVFYSDKKDLKQALKYSQEANDSREAELTRNLILGSERQKLLYLQQYSFETNNTISLHHYAQANPLAKQLALTQILRRKGRSIDATNQSIEALRKRSNSEDVALLDEISQKKAVYSNLTTQGAGKRKLKDYKEQLKSLEEEIDKLEYRISERSAEFRTQSQPITLQAVQEAIPTDSILVEFASYRIYNPKTKEYGKTQYAVYLLNNKGEIDSVDLGDAEKIDALTDDLRAKLRNRKTKIERDVKPLARELDKLVMEPVRKLAGKGKRLLVAPDGKLNLLPFAALVDENGKFLVENTSISYLTSGRDLLRLKVKVDSKSAPVIIGDPDFGPLPDAAQVAKIKEENKEGNKEGNTVFSRLAFNPLPATELEAKAIKELYPDAKLLLQKQASEEALSQLNAPSILHIATHGFFLKEEDQPVINTEENRIGQISGTELGAKDLKIENPLLRSGLALSGANLHKDEKETGIFTALKTTGLNLWGTKVVVLSACDTGVGEVKTGDGIYGLRRALVLAGSETQVMSLWPISDSGTKELMIDYYKRLQKGEGRAEALRQVQLSLLKSKLHQHPYFWASFIQSGEWANLDGNR